MSQAEPRFPSFTRGLVGIYKFNLRAVTKTGLLIRRPSKAQLSIGGADVWPMTLELSYKCSSQSFNIEVPYIPGSSLKGRMRSLTELSLNLNMVTTDGKIYLHVRSIEAFKRSLNNPADSFYDDVINRCPVDEIFGYASFQYQHLQDNRRGLGLDPQKAKTVMEMSTITRLYVEDLYPSEDYVCQLFNTLQRPPYLHEFLEEKSENRIDRLTSAADPRDMVRVRPGVVFAGSLSLLVFDLDLDKCDAGAYPSMTCLERNINIIGRSLELVEQLGLGAATSRGYGRVHIGISSIEFYKPFEGSKPVTTQELRPSQLVERSSEIARVARASREE